MLEHGLGNTSIPISGDRSLRRRSDRLARLLGPDLEFYAVCRHLRTDDGRPAGFAGWVVPVRDEMTQPPAGWILTRVPVVELVAAGTICAFAAIACLHRKPGLARADLPSPPTERPFTLDSTCWADCRHPCWLRTAAMMLLRFSQSTADGNIPLALVVSTPDSSTIRREIIAIGDESNQFPGYQGSIRRCDAGCRCCGHAEGKLCSGQVSMNENHPKR